MQDQRRAASGAVYQHLARNLKQSFGLLKKYHMVQKVWNMMVIDASKGILYDTL